MAAKLSLLFIAFCVLMLTSRAAHIQKREVEQSSVISDANQAIDKMLEDLTKGIQGLAKEGINFDGLVQNLTAKANQFGESVQKLGTELQAKVQEAAKKQGLTS